MDYLTYSQKLNYLLEMVEKKRMFTAKQVGEKFNCSGRTIRRMIRMLREQGHPGRFCKSKKIYFIEN